MSQFSRWVSGSSWKTWFPVCGLFVITIIATGGTPYHTKHEIKLPPGQSTPDVDRIRAYMDTVRFPALTLKDVTLREAIDQVQKDIPRYAPPAVPADRRGMSMVLRFREGQEDVRITVSTKPATLPEVLDAICAPHDYVWRVDNFALNIWPREGTGRIVVPGAAEGVPGLEPNR